MQPRPVLATAYCDRGATASTRLAKPGTIAVDPRFVSLGSRVKVVFTPAVINVRALHDVIRSMGRRMFDADDTGGAIKGRRIDVWLPSCHDALQFGHRMALITVPPSKGRS